MNLSELEIELIEQYVEGTLEGKPLTDFQNRVEGDPAFAKEVKIYQQLIYGVESFGADSFEAKLTEWDAALTQTATSNTADTNTTPEKGKVVTMNSRSQYIKYIGLAAALALALFVGTQLFSTSGMTTQQAFNDNFEVYQDVITDRGSADASTLQIGMGLYGKGSYEEAAEALEKYITQEINNETPPNELLPVRFYLANAQLADDNVTEAVNNFKIVSGVENSFQQQSDWFLALAFLKQDNLPNTKAQLNLILQNTKHSYAKKAQKLLDIVSQL